MKLRELLTDARSSVSAFAAARGTRVAIRRAGRLPDLNRTGPALTEILTCLLKQMIKATPRGAGITLGARAVRRGPTRGRRAWVEVTINSRKARLGDRELHRVLGCVEPIRLAEVVTDVHQGELRLTLLCRLLRLKSGWFVIRRGGGAVPTFAVVVRAPRGRR